MQRISVSLLCCAAVSLCCVVVPVIGQDQQAPVIAEVRVDGLRTVAKETVLAAVKDILIVGKPFEAALVEPAQKAVMTTGRFAHVKITTEQADGGAVVVITVVEKRAIRRIFFVGNVSVPTAELEQAIGSKVGDMPDDAVLRRDVRRIEECHANAGRIAHVSQATTDGVGTIVFVIWEAKIEAIEFEGLQRTEPEVVRAQLTTKAGEPFDEKCVARDVQKLFNLGLFDKVITNIQPGKDDPNGGIILIITFTEKPAATN